MWQLFLHRKVVSITWVIKRSLTVFHSNIKVLLIQIFANIVFFLVESLSERELLIIVIVIKLL